MQANRTPPSKRREGRLRLLNASAFSLRGNFGSHSKALGHFYAADVSVARQLLFSRRQRFAIAFYVRREISRCADGEQGDRGHDK